MHEPQRYRDCHVTFSFEIGARPERRNVDAEPFRQVETDAAGRFPPFLDVPPAAAKLEPVEPMLVSGAEGRAVVTMSILHDARPHVGVVRAAGTDVHRELDACVISWSRGKIGEVAAGEKAVEDVVGPPTPVQSMRFAIPLTPKPTSHRSTTAATPMSIAKPLPSEDV